MNEYLIFLIFLAIIIFFIYESIVIKNKSKTNKKNLLNEMDKILNFSLDKFGRDIFTTGLSNIIIPEFKLMKLSKEETDKILKVLPIYVFEFSIVVLYLVHKYSISKNKVISIEEIEKFAIKSYITSFKIFAFGITKEQSNDDIYNKVLKNRFNLYIDKSNSQIKDIFCNICFEEIYQKKCMLMEHVSFDNISGNSIMLTHINKIFENNSMFLLVKMVYMYIDIHRNEFEDSKDRKSINNIETVYEIDRPEPSQFFLNVRRLVGNWLQKEMDKINDTRWIKATITSPAFEHLTFSYKNQVFCVLIDIIDERNDESCLPLKIKEKLIENCKRYNLVPCLYKVVVDNSINPTSIKPYSEGWNLYSAETGELINPINISTDDLIEMSEWELNDFAIQVVRDYITDKLNLKILSYQNIVGIDPQLWFEDEKGNKCYAFVRYTIFPDKSANKPDNIFDIQNKCKGFDAYFASVAFCGNTNNPTKIYRNDANYISFSGLEKFAISKTNIKISIEKFAIEISTDIVKIINGLNIKNLSQEEKLYYLYIYTTEIMLLIYAKIVISKNISATENNLSTYFLDYFEKMTPKNNKGLIDWQEVIVNRCRLYKSCNINENELSIVFTKLCQHELNNGTLFTYESINNLPILDYNKKLNNLLSSVLKMESIKKFNESVKQYL